MSEIAWNSAEFRPAKAESMLAVYRIRRQPMPTLNAASAGFFLSEAFTEPGGLLIADAQKIAFRPSIAAWALSNRLKKASPCGVPGKRLRALGYGPSGESRATSFQLGTTAADGLTA